MRCALESNAINCKALVEIHRNFEHAAASLHHVCKHKEVVPAS